MKARFELHVPDDAVRLQHHVVPAAVDLAFQHLDIAFSVAPHEGQQLAKEQVAQRLLPQARIRRVRRGLDFVRPWRGIFGRLGHGNLIR